MDEGASDGRTDDSLFVKEGTANKDFEDHGARCHPGDESSTLIQDFCNELKTVVEGDVQAVDGVKSVQVVTAFDTAKLCEVTAQSSSTSIPLLYDFDAIAQHVFAVGDYWSSRDLLFNVASQIGTGMDVCEELLPSNMQSAWEKQT